MDIAMNEPPSSGTRWVCPSDRHLALRAKLRTGWSVKTGSFDSRWNNYSNTSTAGSSDRCGQSFVLTEEEQRTIIQVIQRAEALDLSEQKRIGKLVERLEDMKRNVRIITSSRSDEKKSCGSRCFGGVRCVCSCALCGEKFGTVLGASPLLCKDCRKYVCQKCGREAGSLNNSATSTSVEGSTSAAASEGQQQKRTAMQRIVRRSGNNAQKLFLCRICAESREIWKKSGAWFFKGMPKHDLPKKKERDWSRTGQKGANQPSNRSIGACKSLDSTDAQDSSSDEDVARRLSNARSTSVTSPSQENNNNIDNSSFNNNNNASKCTSPAASSASSSQNALSPGTSSSRSPKTRSNGLSPPAQREESFSSLGDKLSKSNLSIPSQCNRLSPSASAVTLRSQQQHPSLEESASVEEQVLKHAGDVVPHYTADCNDRCKGSQVQSLRRNSPRSPSPLMERIQEEAKKHEKGALSDSNKTNWTSSNDAPSSIWYVHNVDQTKLRTSPAVTRSETEENYGTLEVSLLYDPVAQCLQCKVQSARDLRPMDIHGLADPYCKLNILPVGMGTVTKHVRTRTIRRTRDPMFNETVNFYVTKDADMKSGRALHVLILQDDPWGEDFLGEARFPLFELEPFRTRHYKVPLQNHYPVSREEEAWGIRTGNRGQIQITLTYCTRKRALMVTIHQAMNLLPMDNNGFSDPFGKLYLVENASDNQQQQQQQMRIHDSLGRISSKKQSSKKVLAGRNSFTTSVKWRTLNPEWNEEFAFGIRLTDLMKVTLCLSMWDKDFAKSNDYLGGLTLGCNSTGARLRHWIDVIKAPDQRHPAWHNLTETVPPTE